MLTVVSWVAVLVIVQPSFLFGGASESTNGDNGDRSAGFLLTALSVLLDPAISAQTVFESTCRD